MWQFHPIERPVQLTGLYTAFEKRYTPDYVFRGETHNFYELLLILDGSLEVTAGADSFLLDAPAAVLHPPMEFHSFRAERGMSPTIMVFTFSAQALPSFEKHVFSLSEENIKRARHALSLLYRATAMTGLHAGNTYEGKEKEAQQALLELEILLLTLSETVDSFAKKELSASNRNYRRALRVIEENILLPLNTAELARLTHMSPSLLKKTFARHAGVGVMEYVRTRKINAAIPMLRQGENIQEIAARLGFANAGYFSTVFRRVTGLTPSYYRNH